LKVEREKRRFCKKREGEGGGGKACRPLVSLLFFPSFFGAIGAARLSPFSTEKKKDSGEGRKKKEKEKRKGPRIPLAFSEKIWTTKLHVFEHTLRPGGEKERSREKGGGEKEKKEKREKTKRGPFPDDQNLPFLDSWPTAQQPAAGWRERREKEKKKKKRKKKEGEEKRRDRGRAVKLSVARLELHFVQQRTDYRHGRKKKKGGSRWKKKGKEGEGTGTIPAGAVHLRRILTTSWSALGQRKIEEGEEEENAEGKERRKEKNRRIKPVGPK